MKERIQKVAVLGAGVMGSGIAAHCANAGIPVLLLDIVPPDAGNDKKLRNKFAATALEKAMKQKPAPFFSAARQALVQVGNLEDDLQKIADCDWVVEVVKEDMKVKKALFEKVDKVRKPGTLVSSNTSGLSLHEMGKGRSDDFRKHFFVSHFFNPVRYMHLLELVAGPETEKQALDAFADFGERRLGKGIVWGKDTPNFVANRIGTYSMLFAIHEMMRQGLTISEVDAICGPPLGRPKSAAFRTADIVGLDTFVHVADNCFESLPKDPERDVFKIPEFLTKLVKEGKLGDKTGSGFYQKTKDGILALDWKTGEMKPQEKVRIDSLGVAKNTDDVAQRVKLVVNADDKAGKFAWPVTAHTLAYAAWRLGEIADDVKSIDDAMRWGFNWDMGPFETWDALGVKETVEHMKKDNIALPEWVDAMLKSGKTSFYTHSEGKTEIYSAAKKAMQPAPSNPRKLTFKALKEQKKRIVDENLGAALVDLGDGCLALEFHTKMNTIDADIIGFMTKAVDEAEKNYRALVIANDGENFSAGANLMLIYMLAQQKDWENLSGAVKGLQNGAMRLRYSDIPVVAAPFGLALGGGCETAMAADAMRANSELYMGLVEAGAGVIPSGSGTKELLFRTMERVPESIEIDYVTWTGKVFETIAMAKVSTSADEARTLGFLRPQDVVSMNREYLLYEAKATALGLADAGYTRPSPRRVRVGGRSTEAALKAMVGNLVESKRATEHDGKIATKLAHILSGGDVAPGTWVTEQEILALEEEAFLSLAGEEKSQARMQALVMTGKPLRN